MKKKGYGHNDEKSSPRSSEDDLRRKLTPEDEKDILHNMREGVPWKDMYRFYEQRISWWGFRKACRRIKKLK